MEEMATHTSKHLQPDNSLFQVLHKESPRRQTHHNFPTRTISLNRQVSVLSTSQETIDKSIKLQFPSARIQITNEYNSLNLILNPLITNKEFRTCITDQATATMQTIQLNTLCQTTKTSYNSSNCSSNQYLITKLNNTSSSI